MKFNGQEIPEELIEGLVGELTSPDGQMPYLWTNILRHWSQVKRNRLAQFLIGRDVDTLIDPEKLRCLAKKFRAESETSRKLALEHRFKTSGFGAVHTGERYAYKKAAAAIEKLIKECKR